jgi:hypothetical protein
LTVSLYCWIFVQKPQQIYLDFIHFLLTRSDAMELHSIHTVGTSSSSYIYNHTVLFKVFQNMFKTISNHKLCKYTAHPNINFVEHTNLYWVSIYEAKVSPIRHRIQMIQGRRCIARLEPIECEFSMQ